jgi:ribonuclease Z
MIQSELKSKIHEDICLLASPDNHGWSYLFDCGKASYLTIADVMRLKAVFITHTHVDHFVNFDAIIRNRAGSRVPLTITGPENISKNVQGKLMAYTWNLLRPNGSYFEVREIMAEGIYKIFRLYSPTWKLKYIETVESSKVFEFEKISSWFSVLDHKIPSIAYRIEEENHVNISEFPFRPGPWINTLKNAYQAGDSQRIIDVFSEKILAQDLFKYLKITAGYSLGYAMDHLGGGLNHQKLEIFFKAVDELYIESFFRHADLDYARRHHHCTAYLSGLLARQAGVKKLHLVHHSRRYHSEVLDLIEEGRAAYEDREPKFQFAPESRF